MSDLDVDVLIVGGGAAGLSASNLLARLGVGSLLVERHAGTSHLPKAHYLNQRTMEIYRQIGLADAIYARGAPAENMSKIIWQTSLGGDGPFDGKVIHAADAMGGGRFAGEHAQKGATRGVNIGQLHLEPILRGFAEHSNPRRVRFGHELVGFEQTETGVEAVVRDLDANEIYKVRARYLLAADGGKFVGPTLGVKMLGPTDLADYVGVYFKADLSRFIHDDTSVMRVILHTDQQPGRPPVGGLLAFGPDRWDRHSQEWAVGWGFAENDPERFNEDNIAERIQAFLKVDAPIELIHVSHWKLEAVVADSFQVGRVFLLGDAAHRHTPGGGLGLNSAVQDAHNICWKLALVLQGRASEALLSTYEAERRPVVVRNAENSLLAFGNHNTFVSAMGLMPGAPPEMNLDAFQRLFSDTADGRARRARVSRVFDAIVGMEYGPHDLEMGFQYESAAIVSDGTPSPERDSLGSHYQPTTHPGCRLPHVLLQENGVALSTHDLLPTGGFLLIAGANGHAWVDAAKRLARERGLPVRAVRIGVDGDLADPSGAWAQISETASGGAVLVRPDGHVGFRANAAARDAVAALDQAFDRILALAAVRGPESVA